LFIESFLKRVFEYFFMASQSEKGNLTLLTAEESILYDQLRRNHWGDRVRLEHEKISFDYLLAALGRL